MSGVGNVFTEEQVQNKVEDLRAALERRNIPPDRLDLEAAARLALEARSRLTAVREELIEARAEEPRPTREAQARERGLPTDEASMHAFARKANEKNSMIHIKMHGFLDLRFTIHLSADAVQLLSSSVTVFNKVLSEAAEGFPEIEAIMFGLQAFISGEAHAIEAVSEASGGPVRLEGIIPSPVVLPLPDEGDDGDGGTPPPPPPVNGLVLTMNSAGAAACRYVGDTWQSFRVVDQADGSKGIRAFYTPSLVLTMNSGGVYPDNYAGNAWQSFSLAPQADGSTGIRAFYS